MQFTNEQRLIVAMLAEIHTKLEIDNGLDSALISEAVYSGNDWAIEWHHNGLFEKVDEKPEHVKHVVDVLDMWRFIEEDFAKLSTPDQDRFKAETGYSNPTFPGFDGNNEADQMSAARMLTEKLGSFGHFKGRGGLNSHMPTIERSERMLAVFIPLRKTLGVSGKGALSVDDLIAIFKAGVHPSRRSA